MNDLRHSHVTMTWKGKKLLGEITGQSVVTAPGGTVAVRLTVRHFNGDPWPVEPTPGAVYLLEREYEPTLRQFEP
jgi:hypothetical protein